MADIMQIFAYFAGGMGAGILGTFGVCWRPCYWTTRATLAAYRCINLACYNPPFTRVFDLFGVISLCKIFSSVYEFGFVV